MRRHLKFILSVTGRHWRSIGRGVEWSALLLRRDYWSKWIQLSLSTSLELTEAALEGRLCGTRSWQERGGRSSWWWPHFWQYCSFAWGLMVSRWQSLGPNLGQPGSRVSQPPFCSISEEKPQEDPGPGSLSLFFFFFLKLFTLLVNLSYYLYFFLAIYSPSGDNISLENSHLFLPLSPEALYREHNNTKLDKHKTLLLMIHFVIFLLLYSTVAV